MFIRTIALISMMLPSFVFANTAVHSIRFSPDGSLLAVGKAWQEGQVEVWDWSSKQLLHSFGLAGDINKLGFSEDGTYLAAHSILQIGDFPNHSLCVWHLPTGTQERCWSGAAAVGSFHIAGRELFINNIAYSLPGLTESRRWSSADSFDLDVFGDQLASGGFRVQVNDGTTSREVSVFAQGTNPYGVNSYFKVSWSPAGDALLTGNHGGLVTLWSANPPTTGPLLLHSIDSGFSGEIFTGHSLSGNLIIVGEQDTGAVQIYDAHNYQLLHSFTDHCGPLLIRSSRVLNTMPKPETNPYRFAISPDDQFLVYACGNTYKAVQLDGGINNQTPVVVAKVPARLQLGKSAMLLATATDQEDGDLSAQVIWSSSLDGHIGTGTPILFTPTVAGIHSLTAQVTDTAGQTATAETAIRVETGGSGNQWPNAKFKFNVKGRKVKFRDRSNDIDGKIVSRRWLFGDGQSAKGKKPRHKYKKRGHYKVFLTVTDDEGAQSSTMKIIKIK